MAVYDGLTRNTWPGTWSPSSTHPIVLDTEVRGSLRFVSLSLIHISEPKRQAEI